ncbi:MAG: hypothetical protein OEU60_13400, partial [Gammaproteobacteria bacterium]|nr:hypothetical protein [Gammaproteobacteria bacterium]
AFLEVTCLTTSAITHSGAAGLVLPLPGLTSLNGHLLFEQTIVVLHKSLANINKSSGVCR